MALERMRMVQPQDDAKHPSRREFVALGAAAERTVNAALAKEILDGRLIEGVGLEPFADNTINHGLGRKLLGWLPVRRPVVPANLFAYRDAAGTQNAGWATTIMDTISSEENDGTSNFDTTTGVFTCPSDGYYRVEFQCQFSGVADGTTLGAAVSHNGSRARESSIGANGAIGNASVGASVRIRCSATDTLQPMVYHNAGAALTMANGSGPYWLTIDLIDDGIGDRQDDNETPERTLVLRCSIPQTVSLWVF